MKFDYKLTILKKIILLALVQGLIACNNIKVVSKKAPPLSSELQNHLLVATSDYYSGALVEIDLVQSQTQKLEVPIHSDAIVRCSEDGKIFYVVNRLGADNIEWGSREKQTALRQFSVGRGTNPQDIAVVSSQVAYVTRLASNKLLKVNPDTGETLKEIDLLAHADSATVNSTDRDGFPEMTWMKIVGHKLWVVMQRLNADEGYSPSNKSQIAILNIPTDRVEGIVTLAGTNPVTEIKQLGNEFAIGQAGKLGVLDGGVELFDGNLKSKGWVTTEKQLGGDIVDSAMIDDERGLAIIAKDIYGTNPKTQLVAFRKGDGQLISIVKDTGNYALQQIVLDGARKLFYVSERDPRKPGIWVFDTKTLQPLFDTYYETGLPPYHMVLTP